MAVTPLFDWLIVPCEYLDIEIIRVQHLHGQFEHSVAHYLTSIVSIFMALNGETIGAFACVKSDEKLKG